jgi:hypothetical protein
VPKDNVHLQTAFEAEAEMMKFVSRNRHIGTHICDYILVPLRMSGSMIICRIFNVDCNKGGLGGWLVSKSSNVYGSLGFLKKCL